MRYILNPTNNAVSTHSATPAHLCAHDGVLYGSDGESLVSFDGDAEGLTVITGDIDFGSGKGKTIGNSYLSGKTSSVQTVTAASFGRRETEQVVNISAKLPGVDARRKGRFGRGACRVVALNRSLSRPD